jgi:hypothetical protein
MGTVRVVDAQIPGDEVIESCGLGIGYSHKDGKKCVCLVLAVEAGDEHYAVAHSIEPDDMEAVTDAMNMLNSNIGIDDWPNNQGG